MEVGNKWVPILYHLAWDAVGAQGFGMQIYCRHLDSWEEGGIGAASYVRLFFALPSLGHGLTDVWICLNTPSFLNWRRIGGLVGQSHFMWMAMAWHFL